MARTRDDFLEDCEKGDRDAYKKLFGDIEDLARRLGDPDPADSAKLGKPFEGETLRLRIDFGDKKGASLRLQHPKLEAMRPAASEKRTKAAKAKAKAAEADALASLLSFFPTTAPEATPSASVLAVLRPLPKAGVRKPDIDAYALDLRKGPFEAGGASSLKTTTAGMPGGVDRAFRWDNNRKLLVDAIATLVGRIDTY